VIDIWFASFHGHNSSFVEELALVGGEQVLRVYYEHTFDNNTWAKKPQETGLGTTAKGTANLVHGRVCFAVQRVNHTAHRQITSLG